jgi:hypothetical protein
MDTSHIAHLYFNKMVHLYGIHKCITLDKDMKFISNFSKSLYEKLDTQLNFSNAYHSQTYG